MFTCNRFTINETPRAFGERRMISVHFQCFICGATQDRVCRASFPNDRMALRCAQCGVAFVHPLPGSHELETYYSQYPTTVDGGDAHAHQLIERHRRILRYLERHAACRNRMSVLDFGFGSGAFLKLVAQEGHLAYGAEFSEQNCDQIRRYQAHGGATVSVVNLARSKLEDLGCPQFDLITLFQVIEHVLDPVALLRDLRRRLKVGGVIYIECPNEDAWYLRVKNLLRKCFHREGFFGSLNPPQHLFGFGRRALTLALERADFNVIEIRDYPFGDGIHQVETIDWYPSVSEWLSNRAWWNMYGFAKLVIKVLDSPASRLFNRGGGLYALARIRDSN